MKAFCSADLSHLQPLFQLPLMQNKCVALDLHSDSLLFWAVAFTQAEKHLENFENPQVQVISVPDISRSIYSVCLSIYHYQHSSVPGCFEDQPLLSPQIHFEKHTDRRCWCHLSSSLSRKEEMHLLVTGFSNKAPGAEENDTAASSAARLLQQGSNSARCATVQPDRRQSPSSLVVHAA